MGMAAEEAAADHRIRLLSRVGIAEGTIAFQFEKPADFVFKPGQCADMTLPEPPETDAAGNGRAFSIASSPFENHLMFATRMRDTAFKRSLKQIPLGAEVKITPAMGSFTLHKNTAKPAVFLSGGIGITPFLSILRQAGQDRLPQKLYLFYSNRRPEDAPFLDTLQSLDKSNPDFHLICTMTQMPKSRMKWAGETGHIDRAMLSRHLANLQGPIYYVAGPPGMVTGLKEMLVHAGIDEDDIRSEDFAGY
jgi:ferredoxin-NADP reductase